MFYSSSILYKIGISGPEITFKVDWTGDSYPFLKKRKQKFRV